MSLPPDTVVIESIEIMRAPGLPNGLRISGLSPGINVVTGPNASGKSTTARLIHQLFENASKGEPIEATIRLRFAGDEWIVHRHGTAKTAYRGSESVALPPFNDQANDGTRNRYLLSLHDLLQADDTDFAQVIMQELAGGFNLDAAVSSLQIKLQKADRTLWNEREAARAMVRKVQDDQIALVGRVGQLAQKRLDEQSAISASASIVRHRRIGELLEASEAHRIAFERFCELPGELANYRPDDDRSLVKLIVRKEEITTEQRSVAERLENTRSEFAASGLESNEHTREVIEQLKRLGATLERRSSQLDIARSAARRSLEREEHQRIGISFALELDSPDESVQSLLLQLAELVAKQDQAQLRVGSLSEMHRWIGEIRAPEDISATRDQIQVLRRWLRTPEVVSVDPNLNRLRVIALCAAIILIVVGAVVAILESPAYAFIAFLGIVMVIAAALAKPVPAVEERAFLEGHEAHATGIELNVWNESSVSAALSELQTIVDNARMDEMKFARWAHLPIEKERADVEAHELKAHRTSLRHQLGITVEISKSGLEHLAESIRVWRELVDRLIGDRASLKEMVDLQDETVREITALSVPLGASESLEASELPALIIRLDARYQQAQKADQTIVKLEGEVAAMARALEECEGARMELFSRTGAKGDEELRQRVSMLSDWEEAKRALDTADVTLRERRRELEDVDLMEWSQERVAQELAELIRNADRQITISQEIGAIERDVQVASDGDTLDKANRMEARLTGELRSRYDERVGQIALNQLARYVRVAGEQSTLSPVAAIAQRLFAGFTENRYILHFRNSDGKPNFVAEDRDDHGRELALDQLSSASRVQLLLAVRAAFVEHKEQHARLPLLLDETLANSDDLRADAMVSAMKGISDSGRQVFYFTAQEDEVERWQTGVTSVPVSVHRLGTVGTTRPVADVVRVPRDLPTAVPSPDDCSHEEYRQRLGILQPDRWVDTPNDIHLWFLVPDVQRLHALLLRRLNTWGRLAGYIDTNVQQSHELSADEIASMRARSRVCQSIRVHSRIGHGRPVSQLDLDTSGAFTDVFKERAGALLRSCDGDGARFLLAIQTGALKRLAGPNIAQLERYFKEHQHVADIAQLTRDEMRILVIKDARLAIESGAIDIVDVDRLLDDLAANPVAEPLAMQAIAE